MPGPLDPFLPAPDVRERFAVRVAAPSAHVFEVAVGFDMQGVFAVRAIFRAREKLLGGRARPRAARGLVAELEALGWGRLVHQPGELHVAGAHCRPWLADVTFTPLTPETFAGFDRPGEVRIAWTLETTPLGDGRTLLATETRAAATDAASRARFLRYWRWARCGILPIRWLLLPAIRRAAERSWRARR
jgi:hypothetical protein